MNRSRFKATQKLVTAFFKGDYIKTEQWFAAPNPAFGGLSPNLMIRARRDEVVYQWVKTALSENKRLRIRNP